VQCSFGKFIRPCDEAREVHNSVMVLLPNDEQEKQQTWFNGKMLIFSGFKDDVQKWLNTESQVSRSGVDGDAFQEDIQPNDSVSNISNQVNHQVEKVLAVCVLGDLLLLQHEL